MENTKMNEDSILIVNESYGIYVPMIFAERIDRKCINGVNDDELNELSQEPDSTDSYWDLWDKVLNNCIVTDRRNNVQYSLYQDGDLWLVPLD
jgi:hypothetical protein